MPSITALLSPAQSGLPTWNARVSRVSKPGAATYSSFAGETVARALRFRPHGDSVPGGKLGGIVRSALIGFALATLEILRAQALQMSSERIADQGGTVDLKPPRHPIGGAQPISRER